MNVYFLFFLLENMKDYYTDVVLGNQTWVYYRGKHLLMSLQFLLSY